MPEISRFFGIVVKMLWNDHNPPHFHVFYGDEQAVIEINSLTVLAGRLPPRVLGLLIEWAMLHKQELLDDWRRAHANETLLRIEPLS